MVRRKDAYLRHFQRLTQPVSCLRGIGPKKALCLRHKGILTVLDLLFFTPIRYEDRSRISPIIEGEEGDPVLFRGKVVLGGEERFYRSGKRVFKVLIRDATGTLELLWFQYRKPHLARFTIPGTDVLVFGRVRRDRARRLMIHPEIRAFEVKSTDSSPYRFGIYPVYSEVRGLSSTAISAKSSTLSPSLLQPTWSCRIWAQPSGLFTSHPAEYPCRI
jgi:ATP-dependent DNA helicase RecG